MTRFTTSLLFLFVSVAAIAASCAGPLATTLLTVDSSRCIGCGECVSVCPYDAIEVVDGDAVIDPVLCHQCNRCVEVCPEGAIF